MADFTYDELKALPPGGGSNPLANLADAGRRAICGLYRANEGFLFPPNQDDVLPGAGALRGAYKGLLDGMCSDGPLPPEPTVPFSGGQCAGTVYRVRFRTGTNGSLNPTIGSVNVNGPVRGPSFRNEPNGGISIGLSIGNTSGFGNWYPLIAGSPGTTQQAISLWRTQIVDVTPISGPDTCGNPPAAYPANRPSPDAYRGPTTYRDRGVDKPVTWRLPPIAIPVGPVTFSPSLVLEIGEINFNFDFRGAKILPIDISPTFPIGGGPGGTNPNPPVNAPGIDFLDELADRFDRVEDLLKELERCACPKVNTLQANQIAVNADSLNYGPLPLTRNKACAIAITTIPVNRKEEEGKAGPDVLYAGWAWFASPQGYLSERMQIDAQGKIFANPGNYTRFCFTLRQGYRASAFELNLPLT